jgi:hypothetical protein
MSPSPNMITDGGGLQDHVFPFSRGTFDPSFLAPVRSKSNRQNTLNTNPLLVHVFEHFTIFVSCPVESPFRMATQHTPVFHIAPDDDF